MRKRSLLMGLLVAAAVGVSGLLSSPVAAAQSSDDVEPMIVGGGPATENYSFIVYTGGCGGSLIKSNWVVTARHCPTPSSVRVGSNNRTTGGTVRTVNGAISHPTADLKLLRLSSPVSHAPIPIAATSGPVGTQTRILGWGLTCPTRGCGPAPTGLRELNTSIVSDSLCLGIRASTEICTNNPNGNSGACYGDSGGPQIKRVNGAWQLIGATSRSGNGSPVCATGPSIYVDVPVFASWIASNTGGLSPAA